MSPAACPSWPRHQFSAAVPYVLALIGVGLPAVAALALHAYGIPRNDDWAYRWALSRFVSSGHLVGSRWGSMTLVGQILWTAPWVEILGGGAWVPDLAVGVLAMAGLLAAYTLARGFLGPWRATAATATLIIAPGFALSTSSFMTDVPALAASLLSVAAGARSFTALSPRRSAAWLAASCLLGLWAFCIREFSVCAPMAVLLAHALRPGGRRRALLVTAGFGAACVLAYVAISQLPGDRATTFAGPSLAALRTLVAAFITFSFMMAPVIPSLASQLVRSRSGRRCLATAGLCALVCAAWAWGRPGGLYVGNYLWGQGVGGEALLGGGRAPLWSPAAWAVLQALGVVCASVVGASVLRAARRGTGLRAAAYNAPSLSTRYVLVAFSVLYSLMLGAFTLATGQSLWDRYLWPLVFAGAALALGARGYERHRWLWPATAAAGALVLVISSVLTLNSDSFDGARWQAAQAEVARGYPADRVDAGLEWVGSHAPGPLLVHRVLAAAPAYFTWYDEMFPAFRPCALVRASPLSAVGVQLVATRSYQQIAFAVPEKLFVYRVGLHC